MVVTLSGGAAAPCRPGGRGVARSHGRCGLRRHLLRCRNRVPTDAVRRAQEPAAGSRDAGHADVCRPRHGTHGSFITGFPDETIDDALDSFTMALDILQLSARTSAQMHLLAPLPGSPLYQARKDDLRFDGHSSDISMFLLDEAEIANVRRYPDIFPNFYYIPTPHLDRDLAKRSLQSSTPVPPCSSRCGRRAPICGTC